jgi:hypothetical protein
MPMFQKIGAGWSLRESVMKHMTLDEIRHKAEVSTAVEDPAERRRRRLRRLAVVVELHRGTLNLLSRIEFVPQSKRLLLRADSSPLTVAYSDPILRKEGLAGDTLGDAMDFFSLSHREAHHLFCDCHYMGPVRPEKVAGRVRSVANRNTFGQLWAKIRSAVMVRMA